MFSVHVRLIFLFGWITLSAGTLILDIQTKLKWRPNFTSYLIPYFPCVFNLSKHSQGILYFGHIMSYLVILSHIMCSKSYLHTINTKLLMGKCTVGMFLDKVHFYFYFFSIAAL